MLGGSTKDQNCAVCADGGSTTDENRAVIAGGQYETEGKAQQSRLATRHKILIILVCILLVDYAASILVQAREGGASCIQSMSRERIVF